MAREIERKYLVAAEPDPETVLGHAWLRQGYLAVDGDVEVRLREIDGATTMTVKAGKGLSRAEVEAVLAPADADDLWPHAEARSLEKVRSRVALADGWTAELDVYQGRLAGLRTVEVEFTGPDAAGTFVPPAWFGREITGQPGWSNADLASRGSPVPIES